ncbi:uncharacterized protein B0J16DRAFT_402621 [Fusarium flagelliforme]|uniref:uncharacterized protein n=1 Tax=Fusarium flagelliforme TaxID=2675880 RepID=UPI001E8CC669|nr:uncharacterized protein B0J16DRAFT_402621 [Fusarium flagelliforme]KAH7179202.1 hypothetical protein B0J16DRAFT_402621 [Fusarium flagelliforme]
MAFRQGAAGMSLVVRLSDGIDSICNHIPNGNDPSWSLEWLKFALLRDDDLPHEVRSLRNFIKIKARLQALNISAEKAMADHFKSLWDDQVERSSILYPSGVLHRVSTQLFMTFPASFPFYAGVLIFGAIRQASILSYDVRVFPKCISSLEVTAVGRIADLTRLAVGPSQQIKDGDVVIYCMCGGVTVSTTAYRVHGASGFSMEEILPQDSVFAGAEFLGDAFINLLKAKVKEVYPLQVFETFPEEVFEAFFRSYWDGCMELQCPGTAPVINYPFPPPSTSGGYTRVFLSFSADELASILNPIFDKIVTLVRSQIESVDLVPGKSHVVLDGSFGQNPHLKARLKAAVQWLAPSTTTHILSDNLNFKFSPPGFQHFSAVRSRIARASYGVLSKSEGSIIWLVNKGDQLSVREPNRRGLPPQVISVSDTNSGQVNMVLVYRKMGDDLQEQLMCAMKWPVASIESQFEMMTLGSERGLELGFAWNGLNMEVSVFVNGVKPRGLQCGRNHFI